MRSIHRFHQWVFPTAGRLAFSITLLIIVAGAAAAAAAQPCTIEGTWISEADVGAVFFKVANRGANANTGTLFIEWVVMDPTLFGNFPDAVSLTQGVGVWRQQPSENTLGHGLTYYTWVAYGLGSDGLPIYVVKVTGSDALQGCNNVTFDYVMDIFLAGQDPFADEPVACLAGTGVKERIPIATSTCD